MKKGQIIYVQYGVHMEKARVIATDGKNWVAKLSFYGFNVDSFEERALIVTKQVKKWWQFWL